MLNLIKGYLPLIFIAVGAGVLMFTYSSGYSDGQRSIQAKVDEANTKAEMLQKQIDNQEEKVVTKYVYKDRVITKKQEVLIGKVDNELKNESAECRIGPAFVRLHNTAADSSN